MTLGSLLCSIASSNWAGLTSVPTTEAKCLASSRVPWPEPQPTSTASSEGRPFWWNMGFTDKLQGERFPVHPSDSHASPGSPALVAAGHPTERSCTSSRKLHDLSLQTDGTSWLFVLESGTALTEEPLFLSEIKHYKFLTAGSQKEAAWTERGLAMFHNDS